MESQNKTRNINHFFMILGVCGLVFSAIAFIHDKNNQNWSAFILLVCTIIAFVYFYWAEIKKDNIINYNDIDDIKEFIKKAVTNSNIESILYYGRFHDPILNLIDQYLPEKNY